MTDKAPDAHFNPDASKGAADTSYTTQQNDPVPVQADDAQVEALPGDQDTNAQLEKDDKEAIDKSNIIGDKTRHAKPKASYQGQDIDQ